MKVRVRLGREGDRMPLKTKSAKSRATHAPKPSIGKGRATHALRPSLEKGGSGGFVVQHQPPTPLHD